MRRTREKLTASTTRGEEGGGVARREELITEQGEIGGSEVKIQAAGFFSKQARGPEDRRGLEEQQRDVAVTLRLR
jgi:hypothetical protein